MGFVIIMLMAAMTGGCGWLAWRLVQMEKLDRRRLEKLAHLRRELESVTEKLYMAEREREWFQDELERVKAELALAKDGKKRAELRCVGASMELQKAVTARTEVKQ